MSNKISKKKYQKCGDVTIYDHANSNSITNRLKKSDLVDKEKCFDVVDIDFDNDEETLGFKKIRNRKSKPYENDDDKIYTEYHVDIWFLISEHIKPENVGVFGLICKKTSFVIKSAKFWFFLYRKYYKPYVEVPIRLQPDSMIQLDGLRSCAIRALFYTYSPFVQRITSSREQDFHCVVRKQCISMWYQQNKDSWNFCFKFKRRMNTESETHKKLRNKKEDIYNNSEEGCQILVIATTSFRPLLQFYTQKTYLSSIAQTLSTGFTNNKLKLVFSDYCNHPIEMVVFDPVSSIKIFDWWNPNYLSYTQ